MTGPDKIGTLGDRMANRILRHFPGPRVEIAPVRPIVSFTFDDVPESAWTHGAPILEAAGARGTFYLSGGLVGRQEPSRRLISLEGCRDLAARGHELGCHTFAHRKLASLGAAGLAADLDRNAAFLAGCDGRTGPRNFAVPYTMSWPLAQPELRRRFRTSRGGERGINRGPVDPYNLATHELRDGGLEADAVGTLLDDLLARPGWLIFFTHEIAASPTEFGCTEANFAHLVAEAARRGCEILNVEAAVEALGFSA